jgi:hypothetical protein
MEQASHRGQHRSSARRRRISFSNFRSRSSRREKKQLTILSSVGTMTMTLFSSLAMTISSTTAVSTPTACMLWTCVEIASLMAGLQFDTLLNFDGLLVFLVGTIALTLFATPLLTNGLGSAIAIAVVTLYKVHGAYSAFVALAPGSLPSSGAGFWKAAKIARSGSVAHGTGFLQSLSLRQGPTPYTIGTVTHQQVNQQSPGDVQQYFGDRLALFATLQSDGGSATSSSCGCIFSPDIRTFGCSTCSPQRTNCGAHVILHPSDFEQVVQNGWGEVHPLASTSCPFSRSCGNPCLPGTLTLVYAPREYSEVCTVTGIVEAGSKYLASFDGKTI